MTPFVDEKAVNAARRDVYVRRIRRAIERIGVIDGRNAIGLATDLVDSFEFALRHHLAEWSRVELRPQLGLGTQEWMRVRGRVAEKSKVSMPEPEEERFDILVSCWYRFLISGMPITPIRLRHDGREVLTATDEEGFFDAVMSREHELGINSDMVEVELGENATVRADKESCPIILPGPDTSHVVVVDLDGTLLEHPRGRFAQVMAEIILDRTQHLLLPLDDFDQLVRALCGLDGTVSPTFYLSQAPRHLYGHMWAIRDYAGLPEGYLQLFDYDLKLRELALVHDRPGVVMMLSAQELVEPYPEQRFIFVGTTRRYPIYAPLLNAYGERIERAYLIGSSVGLEDGLNELSETSHTQIFAGSARELLEGLEDET
jgi:phosphatidate phosphatase APP1